MADQDHLRYKDLLAWDTAMMALDDRFDFLSNKCVWEECGRRCGGWDARAWGMTLRQPL